MLIIPAVDIKDGKVVRLYQGDFSKESQYGQDPLEAALHWQDQGAQLIHIVDLNGALEGKPINKDLLVKIIKATSVEVEVGGGLRDVAIINEFLDAGARRVVLGSKVFSDYSFLDNFKGMAGERIAVSIDAKFINIREKKDGTTEIIMDVSNFGWLKSQEVNLGDILQKFYDYGIRFINFTSIARDGTMTGPDFAAIEVVLACARNFSNLNLIASGGITTLSDIKRLKELNSLYGAIVGKALYEGKLDFRQALS
ncbi:MAG: 1-(5-phosphoribosyl)-5-[(5-phosphoribosylamino)methylideneamino] imidazole-4-carboxamide isomerase [Candidatus Omnitrophica bacterium]|nr:1-(5-phosphoribosyl)-5-[(5-phosphoribosylamino)methylideneamino] imidazole-4-carboxamide isomerase [Candidatus Omnitrophota bacterium]